MENLEIFNPKTRGEYEELINRLSSDGYVWSNGKKLSNHNIYLDNGFTDDKVLYIDKTYKIVEYSDISYAKTKYSSLEIKSIDIPLCRKKYCVVIPNGLNNVLLLSKRHGNAFAGMTKDEWEERMLFGYHKEYLLTEEEIKAIDERYWQFSVEV